jgi:hypothetical protein
MIIHREGHLMPLGWREVKYVLSFKDKELLWSGTCDILPSGVIWLPHYFLEAKESDYSATPPAVLKVSLLGTC